MGLIWGALPHWRHWANGNGYGAWNGNGYGYGDGYGDGNGAGYGYGAGYGHGAGNGYGYGDGYGAGYGHGAGYGYGNGYWQSIASSLAQGATGVVAFWRSDGQGRPCNGGSGTQARPGLTEEVRGPLQICSAQALHATLEPFEWGGERLWVVALHGEIQQEGDKLGALKREIICEVTHAWAKQ